MLATENDTFSFIDGDSGDVGYTFARDDDEAESFSLASGDCKKSVEFISQFEIGDDFLSSDLDDMDQGDTEFGKKHSDSFSKFPLGAPRIISNGFKKNSILPLFFVAVKSMKNSADETYWKLTVFLPHSFGRKNSSGVSFTAKRKPKVTLQCSDSSVKIQPRSPINYDNGKNTWGTFTITFTQKQLLDSRYPLEFTYKLAQDEGYVLCNVEQSSAPALNLDKGVCDQMRAMADDDSFDFALLGTDGARVSVHKFALILFDPPYFSVCFRVGMKECNDNTMVLPNCNQRDLDVLKSFVYCKPMVDYYSLELLDFSLRVGSNKGIQEHFISICCDRKLDAPVINSSNVFYYKREFASFDRIQRTCAKVMETLKMEDIKSLVPQDALLLLMLMKDKYNPDPEEPPKKKRKLMEVTPNKIIHNVIDLDSPTRYAGVGSDSMADLFDTGFQDVI